MTPVLSQAPASVRRAAYAALGVSLLHIVFGAIVRISGSGMGCGDHWPKCYGYWFPPLERMDLIIEVFHRYLASLLLVTVGATVFLAWRNKQAPRVSGRGGVLRSSGLMLAVGFFAAAFGAVTVNFSNAWWATVIHKAIAVTVLALGAATVVRAGGLGAASVSAGNGTPKAIGGATAAAVMALLVVLLGGLTAKVTGAPVACVGFPLCGEGSLGGGPQHLQLTHRLVAYLLVAHLISLPFLFRRRGEPMAVQTAAWIGMVFGVLQVCWAAWMVIGGIAGPDKYAPRSLHQATGILIWVTAFVMTYLARIAAGRSTVGAQQVSGVPGTTGGAMTARAVPSAS